MTYMPTLTDYPEPGSPAYAGYARKVNANLTSLGTELFLPRVDIPKWVAPPVDPFVHKHVVEHNAAPPSRVLATQGRRDALVAFMAEHGVRLPHREVDEWRLTACTPGQIDGLPSTRGLLVATNGVLCYILRTQGLFLGHLRWFVADPIDEQSEPRSRRTPAKHDVDLSEYEELL